MKKKNLFMSMLAMASMLFATSCSQDEVLNEPTTGEFVNAQFTVSTSEGIGTRAVGDGTTVNYVACAVYNAANEEMKGLRQYVSLSDKKATYSVRLVKGQAYRVAFFAYNGQAGGSSAYYDMTDLKNIQIKDAVSNIEARDAFTNYVDVSASETTVAVNKDVKLKRPFAQLNLGAYAEDIEAASQAGIVVDKSKIKVTGVYKAFNAFENKVAGNTGDMTFDFNGLPSEKLKADVDGDGSDEEFDYLALNYLLVGGAGSQKATTDVTFVWETADKTNNHATEFKNVPVQTNYRTNIVGYLLTNAANFNITIDETFLTPDHFVVLSAVSAAELAHEMIPVNGVINLTKDYVVTDAWTPLVFSENITINGNGHTIQGLDKALVLRANGVNISINDLTIEKSNISYSASDANETALGVGGFISYQDAAGTATFNNCHLKNSTVNGNERAAGLIGYTSGNQLTVTNCTVEGCTIKATGSTGGIVAHTQTTVSISGSKVENSTIESTEDRSTKAAIAGGIIGTIMGATTFDNVTVSGNTVINKGATPHNEKVGRVVSPGTLTDN